MTGAWKQRVPAAQESTVYEIETHVAPVVARHGVNVPLSAEAELVNRAERTSASTPAATVQVLATHDTMPARSENRDPSEKQNISLTAALASPRLTFVVLLAWGSAAAAYAVLTRGLWSLRHSPRADG